MEKEQSTFTFTYRKKFLLFFQGKNGKAKPFMKGLQILKLVNIDDGNTTIKKFKYPVSLKREFLKELANFEKSIIQLGEQSLLLVYVCGETWLQEGKIWIDMGSHSFCIEDKINKFCFGGDKTAIWSIYNCSRSVKRVQNTSIEVKF